MKTNLILAILAALLAVPTTLSLLSERTVYKRPTDEPKLFEGFTKDAIAMVRIARQKLEDGQPKLDEQNQPVVDAAVFMLNDGKWFIADGELRGVPVVAGKVDADVLDHLRRIRVDRERLIEPNATDEALAARDLTEQKSLVIECFDREGKSLAKLLVGKDASGGRYTEEAVPGFFVRRADGREIVLYDHEQAQFWNPSVKAEDWIEKKVHQFETAKVKQLTLRNDKGTITFKRERASKESSDADKWVAENAPEGVGAVRQQEVQNLLSRFSTFYAQRFVRPLALVQAGERTEYGLGEQPDVEVTAVMDDDKSFSVAFGKKIADKQEYYARANESNFLLAAGEWDVTPYQREPKDLFDPLPEKDGPKESVEEPGNEVPPPPEVVQPGKEPPAAEQPKQDPPKQDPPAKDPPGQETPPPEKPATGEKSGTGEKAGTGKGDEGTRNG